jgi:hypothetical protein
MKTPREQRVQHRRHRVDHGTIAADQGDAIAAPHLIAGAGHRHIQIADAARDNTAGQRRHAIGIARAHAQHDLVRMIAERRQQMVLNHVLDLIGAVHRDNDAARGTGEFSDRRGRPAANFA